jgi:hypothetical protein
VDPLSKIPLKKSLFKRGPLPPVIACTLALYGMAAHGQATSEARSLEEVRSTVINLLQTLVQKGVVTREQAEAMVASAQKSAEVTSETKAATAEDEKDAVRVAYVPESVRKQISAEVSAAVRTDVANDVVAQAKREGWGVPGALPDWLRDVRLYGDVRVRSEGNLYAEDNAPNVYLDFNRVNDAGGIGRAGVDALLNVSEDRTRLVGRMRAGLTAGLGNAFALDLRLASGNVRTPVSTNQTLGTYGGRWTVNVDKAAVLWNPINSGHDRELDVRFGRFGNPFANVSELVWDNDVTFEGLSMTYALDVFGDDATRMERTLFLTVGAFPLQEVELSTRDKWLYAGQLGFEVPFASSSRVRLTAGYYAYRNITGVRNEVDSNLFDFTAARFVQKGNTLFDIRNDTDTGTNLFALAGDYEIANANLLVDFGFGSRHVMLTADYVKNLGWDSEDVQRRTTRRIDERVDGYDVGVTVGMPTLAALWDWRGYLRYRYVERDAVLDAFTDSDFHLGGTDAKGYELGFDLGLSRGSWLRMRYITTDAIDGPPLGIDVWQVDWNGAF